MTVEILAAYGTTVIGLQRITASMSADKLLAVVEALQLATGDAESWSKAFDSLADAVGASGMLIGDLPHSAGRFDLIGHRIDPDIVERINGPLATRDANPLFCAVPRAPVHRPVIISTVLDDRKLRASAAYDQAMHPAGLHFCMTAVLSSDSVSSYALAFGREFSRGDFGDAEARRLAVLSPHILAAVQVHHRIEALRSQASILEILDRGIVALDAYGHLLFANKEAERILCLNDGLRAGRTGIEATLPSERPKLRALLCAKGGMKGFGSALALRRPSGLPPFTLLTAPVTPSTELPPALGMRASQILFMHDRARSVRPPRDWLMNLYDLTCAEASVALDLYAGLTPAEIADLGGNSAHTVRSHLKAIFAKVGVTRQAEVVLAIGKAIGDLRPIHCSPNRF